MDQGQGVSGSFVAWLLRLNKRPFCGIDIHWSMEKFFVVVLYSMLSRLTGRVRKIHKRIDNWKQSLIACHFSSMVNSIPED
jgi:hypothetical protein